MKTRQYHPKQVGSWCKELPRNRRLMIQAEYQAGVISAGRLSPDQLRFAGNGFDDLPDLREDP